LRPQPAEARGAVAANGREPSSRRRVSITRSSTGHRIWSLRASEEELADELGALLGEGHAEVEGLVELGMGAGREGGKGEREKEGRSNSNGTKGAKDWAWRERGVPLE